VIVDRLSRAFGALFGGVWRALTAPFREPKPEARPVFVPVDRQQPRSVAGITLRASLVVVGVALGVYLAWELRQLIILAFLGVLFAAALTGPSMAVERIGLPRVLAVLVTYLALLAIFALILFLIFPPLVAQAVELTDDLPSLIEQLRTSVADIVDGFAGEGAGERLIDGLFRGAADAAPDWSTLLRFPLTVAGILLNIVLIVFLSALMLLERDRVRDWALQFVADEDREAAFGVTRTALLKLGAYVRAQLFIMTITGVGTFTGMWLLGVPFAFPLGLLAFIGEAIPMAGAFLAGGPIVLLAALQSPLTGLLMLIWLVVLQQLQGFVIVPIVQGRAVALSPMAVLLSVLAGASLGGIVGAIIAIPVVAVGDVVIRDVVLPLHRAREERRRARAAAAAVAAAGAAQSGAE
jgi:predicted PurR-regulated permease PerM